MIPTLYNEGNLYCMGRDILYAVLGFLVGGLFIGGAIGAALDLRNILEASVLLLVSGLICSFLSIWVARWMSEKGGPKLEARERDTFENKPELAFSAFAGLVYIGFLVLFFAALVILPDQISNALFGWISNPGTTRYFIGVIISGTLIMSIGTWVGVLYAAHKGYGIKIPMPLSMAVKTSLGFLIFLYISHPLDAIKDPLSIILSALALIPGGIVIYLLLVFAQKKAVVPSTFTPRS